VSEDGVPILAGGRPGAREFSPGMRFVPERLRLHVERNLPRVQAAPSFKSPRTRDLVRRFVASFPPDAVVVNVGSGNTRVGHGVVNLDLLPLAHVDVVGTAERLPFATACADGVVLQAVLEHVRRADLTLREVHRILRPGGRVFVEVPFLQGYHPGAASGDYRRFTLPGLAAELDRHGFDVVALGVAVGPGSALAWVLGDFLALALSFGNEGAFRLLRLVTRWVAAPVKYVDRWLDAHPSAYVIASGVWAEAVVRRVPPEDGA
jgi:SAM-dependent methyltransferase